MSDFTIDNISATKGHYKSILQRALEVDEKELDYLLISKGENEIGIHTCFSNSKNMNEMVKTFLAVLGEHYTNYEQLRETATFVTQRMREDGLDSSTINQMLGLHYVLSAMSYNITKAERPVMIGMLLSLVESLTQGLKKNEQ